MRDEAKYVPLLCTSEEDVGDIGYTRSFPGSPNLNPTAADALPVKIFDMLMLMNRRRH
ncbi:MAG: hypothetical protein ACRYGK_02800 [Janthinobacterium lividum]